MDVVTTKVRVEILLIRETNKVKVIITCTSTDRITEVPKDIENRKIFSEKPL